jgi:hypothetical protein
MGLFKKKVPFDPFAPTLKDTMKMLGVVPGEKTREMFGWTEEDDAESIRIAIHKFNESKELLNELKASGATLREVMALEISIKGTENWLRADNHI